MIGWIFAIALIVVYVREPVSMARPELLIAAGLFAVAGSVANGLNTIGNKLKGEEKEENEDD